MEISRSLPDGSSLRPGDPADASYADKRALLKNVVRMPDYEVSPEIAKEVEHDAYTATHLRLHFDDDWTLPAIEFRPKQATSTCILLTDHGRQSSAVEVSALLEEDKRVIAVDLLGFGEANPGSDPDDNDDVIPLLIAIVGERPLGIQAAQLNGIAKWASGPAGRSKTNSNGGRSALQRNRSGRGGSRSRSFVRSDPQASVEDTASSDSK